MKADYLTLTSGQKVRILWNMNALGEWTSYTGREMNELASGKADVETLRSIAWCAAREGEEADGRKLEMDEKEFGRLMDMPAIVQFIEILNSQTSGAAQKKKRGTAEISAESIEASGIELEDVPKFTWAYMRRFALGCLGYTPRRFEKMLVGDFLDAMIGYNDAEYERIKAIA